MNNIAYETLILQHKDSPAVYFEGQTYSYSDLDQLCKRFCGVLEGLGVEFGDRVAISAFDSIELIVAFLSCIRLGLTSIIIDPLQKQRGFLEIIRHACPKLILGNNLIAAYNLNNYLKLSDNNNSEYFFHLIGQNREVIDSPTVLPSEVATIVYTSGTTGEPKGVVHSFGNLLVDSFQKFVLSQTKKDTSYCCSRLFTAFGLDASLLFTFTTGAAVVITRMLPSIDTLRSVSKHKPTLFFAVPSVYSLLTDTVDQVKPLLSSIRMFVAAGDRLSNQLATRWTDNFKLPIVNAYGSTEMNHPFVSFKHGNPINDSCGKPLDPFEVRCNDDGEILYRGPSLALGYFKNKKLTNQKFKDGWFHSGDFGLFDSNGFLYLTGRESSLFKIRGNWVAAQAIEDVLINHEFAKEALVSQSNGQLVFHIVKANNTVTEEDIRHFCKDNLKPYEIPRYINFINEIPKTAAGKVDRKRLESIALDNFE